MNTEIGYIQILKEIKSDILHSRYRIARLANSELLFLYYKIGAKISEKVAVEKWGSKTLQKLSGDLQKEMPGLRGFSYGSLRKMRLFYESWADSLTLTQSSGEISPSITNKLKDSGAEAILSNGDSFIELFTQVSFTSHYEIITKTKTLRERIFYIEKAALEFWTVGTLRNHLDNKLFDQQAGLPNNFGQTLPEKYREKALQSFKNQYLFDFLRIADENEGDETVEFAFRNLNAAMGVATYTTSRKLPEQFKNILPDENMLKNLM